MSKVDVKVVLLGAADAGKTTLIERYLNRRFVEDPQATIGAAFNAKKVTVDGQTTTLGIWDTAGSERYESMSRIYYRSAKAAIICYDISDSESFEKVKFWVTELRDNEPECDLYICGCKLDLAEQSESRMPRADVDAYATAHGARHFETSSMTGVGVDELFYCVAEQAAKKRAAVGAADGHAQGGVRLGAGAQRDDGAEGCAC